MATSAETLSEALEIYNNRYQTALSSNAKIDIDRFKSNINQINSYYDIIYASVGEGALDRAEDALDAIVVILSAEGITVTNPTTPQLPLWVVASPNNINIPTDDNGNNPVFTNASSFIDIYQGWTDITSSWTFTVNSQTNVTAAIGAANEVVISAISDDTGSVTVRGSLTGYSNIDIVIPVKKLYAGADGTNGTNGTDGLGWTGGAYEPSTGVVTFTSNDGLGFVTGDLRATAGTVQNANLSLQPYDEGTPFGNSRGSRAVDLQSNRAFASEIANGTDAAIIGGQNNTASGQFSGVYVGINNKTSGVGAVILGGANNIANEAASCILGGNTNTTNGVGSVAGGEDNTADGANSVVLGENNTASTDGELVCGTFAIVGGVASLLRVGNGASVGSRANAFVVASDGGVFAPGLKTGANQGAAGAASDEIWIDTADNSLKIGV